MFCPQKVQNPKIIKNVEQFFFDVLPIMYEKVKTSLILRKASISNFRCHSIVKPGHSADLVSAVT